MASPDTLKFIFKIVQSVKPGVDSPANDNGVYKVSVGLAIEKNAKAHLFFNSTQGPSAEKLKFYPEKVTAPSSADCFLQLWELDNWMPDNGSTKAFDSWYKQGDEDIAGPGENKWIATLGGVVVEVGKNTWEFKVLDDSELKEPTKDQAYLNLKYMKGGSEVIKKVAIDVITESRWDIGLFPTSNKSGREWEKLQFPFPVYFFDSIRNLIRMQLDEGGLSVAGFSDLNKDAELHSRERYRFYMREIIERRDKGNGDLESRVNAIFEKAASVRLSLKKTALANTQSAKAKSDLVNFLKGKGNALTKSPPMEVAPKSLENFTQWFGRLDEASKKLKSDCKKECWKKVKTIFELEDANEMEFTGATAMDFFEKNDLSLIRELDEYKTETPSNKPLFNISNDMEFPRNAEQLSQEFGFLTLNSEGVLGKGARALNSIDDLVPYLKEVANAVEKKYPELMDGKKPKVFRFVLFTHGGRLSGLKFPPHDWFGVDELTAPAGRTFLDDFKTILATKCVITLFACTTGGNPSIADLQKNAITKMKTDNKKNSDDEKAAITELDPKKALVLKKAIDKKNRKQLNDLLLQESKIWKKMVLYDQKLISYGGNPDSTDSLKNVMGTGSFAELLRNKLVEKGVEADVWAHTDAGHTSRNTRLRLFTADGRSHDLLRLVFEGTTEFTPKEQPSKNQLNWWWERGVDSNPMEHQHAVKKAALCHSQTLLETKDPFNLKKIIADFQKWYEG